MCKEYGPLERLTVEEIPAPQASPGQIVIDVRAASVNYPDALMALGKYQVRPPLPYIPGAELAGIVKSVGEGVSQFQPGTPVVAIPGRGAFAEQVAVNANAAIALDSNIEAGAAAAVPMTYGTAYHALLDRAQLQAGETLLVLGAGGGVGLAAVELGKILGATVIAAASTREKLEAAASRGADHLIDYTHEDLRARLKEIAGDKGVDVVCDPVGGSYTEPALRSTGWRGRYLIVGFAAGDIPRIPLNLPLLKGNALVGVFWGDFLKREARKAFAELSQLMGWLRDGKLRPLIGGTYALDNAREALNAVFERRATGKLLIAIPS
jgi:NADPH2:quinone reductase